MMELLRVTAPRFEVSHVAYKGNAHAINDLLVGHVTLHVSSMLSATPFVVKPAISAKPSNTPA